MMRASSVDGMDIAQVAEKSAAILSEIRTLGEPYFLECKTYRFRAHSMFDPDLYRDQSEVALWKKRDPIDQWRDTLKKQGVLDDQRYGEMKASVDSAVETASTFAQNSPDPDLSSLTDWVLSVSP
jgi:TPP-dependent pyruvate/acetoin dehydrogenase alpha subunit